MSSTNLADQAHRNQALDVSQSFSVQAPAGSGKTELLSLRYLKLLSISEQPEEVLAITFTRKASSEMRDRIIKSIAWAASFETDEDPIFADKLESRRFEIAHAALVQNNRLSWHILDNPSRLRVQTIDSFCHYLSSQLPILSRLGGRLRVSEEVEHIFTDAVRSTLGELESHSGLGDDLVLLLRHLDNDVNKVEKLLIGLLYNRDQWLPHILGIKAKVLIDQTYLQTSLEQLISESLEEVVAGLLPFEQDIVELTNFAAGNLAPQSEFYIRDFATLDALPDTTFRALPYWLLLVNLLLIKAGTWRTRIDVNVGFPPGDKTDNEFDALCKTRKKQLKDLLEQLSDDDDLAVSLDYLRRLPDPNVAEKQWGFLSAVARILALLNAKLLLSFRKFRTIDHLQTGAAARDALVDENAPTDLALVLDHKIQHILVDEFQDTSKLQIDILQQLVAGWQPGDGRTLFVVGDAMQSCYGFRNANVGLFLKVREDGLGDIDLIPLTLKTNFRSQAKIVNWVNNLFSTAFPRQANSSRGAVPYTESVAYKAPEEDSTITTELVLFERGQRSVAMGYEAERVVNQVTVLRKQDRNTSIAILVRTRTHLVHIISALRNADIQWQSTDIDRLESLPSIKDLTNLTRALLNQTDRVAWLALLRAPWCGLNIADLHAIDSFAGANSIWFALQQISAIDLVSSEGQDRLLDVCKIINFAMTKRYRISLRRLIETTWSLLRGPCTAGNDAELESVAHFFQLLDEYETAGGIDDIVEFEAKVARAFVPSKIDLKNPNTIHIMTMHKAKGLEFDHVILPGLAHEPRSNSKPLLQWHERLNEQGESRLFIATLSASGSDDNALYKLLRHEQQHKTSMENTRLLYIATTRAKKSLTLLATVQLNSKGKAEPPKNSLLKRIWRELDALPEGEVCLTQLESVTDQNLQSPSVSSVTYPTVTPIKRFSQPIQLTQEEFLSLRAQESTAEEETERDNLEPPIDESAAAIGTLIHNTLEAVVNSGERNINPEKLNNLRRHWRLQLSHHFNNEDDLNAAILFIESSIVNSLSNETDGWIFSADLEDSRTELALSTTSTGYTTNYLVDRSFIDAQGTRWVIDYKTAKCASDKSLDEFISEQRSQHRSQLENYQTLFKQIENRPVKTALFLTSIAKLVELD